MLKWKYLGRNDAYELEIVMINLKGEKNWSFSARDIFVRPDTKSDSDVFQIQGENVIVHDWEGNKYILDKWGQLYDVC